MTTDQTSVTNGQAPYSVRPPLLRLFDRVGFRTGDVVTLAAKPMRVFAVLALNAGKVVPTHLLIRELWGDAPPPSFMTTLQTYILHARDVIHIDLARSRQGYVMQIDPLEVDALLFRQHVQLIQHYLLQGRLDEAELLVDTAPALVTGPLLGGVHCGEVLQDWATLFEKELLVAAERRFEVLLRQGRHHEILAELSCACVERPYDELLTAKLMLAMYRCGQRLEVSDAYLRLDTAARKGCGLDPSQWMKRLHQRILADDEELLKPSFRLEV